MYLNLISFEAISKCTNFQVLSNDEVIVMSTSSKLLFLGYK